MSLKIECEEYLAEVREIADKIGKRDNLEEQLKYLSEYACSEEDPEATHCHLYKDFAPLSFEFVILRRQKDGSYARWFNGGCIFHGNHDGFGSGGGPTFSVCLNPTDGWSIHT